MFKSKKILIGIASTLIIGTAIATPIIILNKNESSSKANILSEEQKILKMRNYFEDKWIGSDQENKPKIIEMPRAKSYTSIDEILEAVKEKLKKESDIDEKLFDMVKVKPGQKWGNQRLENGQKITPITIIIGKYEYTLNLREKNEIPLEFKANLMKLKKFFEKEENLNIDLPKNSVYKDFKDIFTLIKKELSIKLKANNIDTTVLGSVFYSKESTKIKFIYKKIDQKRTDFKIESLDGENPYEKVLKVQISDKISSEINEKLNLIKKFFQIRKVFKYKKGIVFYNLNELLDEIKNQSGFDKNITNLIILKPSQRFSDYLKTKKFKVIIDSKEFEIELSENLNYTKEQKSKLEAFRKILDIQENLDFTFSKKSTFKSVDEIFKLIKKYISINHSKFHTFVKYLKLSNGQEHIKSVANFDQKRTLLKFKFFDGSIEKEYTSRLIRNEYTPNEIFDLQKVVSIYLKDLKMTLPKGGDYTTIKSIFDAVKNELLKLPKIKPENLKFLKIVNNPKFEKIPGNGNSIKYVIENYGKKFILSLSEKT